MDKALFGFIVGFVAGAVGITYVILSKPEDAVPILNGGLESMHSHYRIQYP